MEDPLGEPMDDVTLKALLKPDMFLKFTCINASGFSMYSSSNMLVTRNEDIHRKSLFIYPFHTYIYIFKIYWYICNMYI